MNMEKQMPRKRSRRLAVAAALALALLAVACGSDDNASSESAAAPATSAIAAKEAAAPSTTADPKKDWPKKLRFVAVPSSEQKAQVERYQPMTEILSKELGIPVEFTFATNYSAVIEAMIAGNVEIAQFGPFAYVIATGNGAQIVPIGIATKEGKEPSYRSYGITGAKNDSIKSLKDFAGKKVCYVDAASTSGYLFPSAGLLEVGINPETGVKGTFAGGHDASAISVANGTCEAGFVFDTMLTSQLIQKGDIKGVVDTVEKETINPEKADVKIVWKSPAIPNGPVAMQKKLPQTLQDAITKVFMEKINVDTYVAMGFCPSKDKCNIGDEDASKYGAVKDSLYDGVRKVCEQTKSAKCKLT